MFSKKGGVTTKMNKPTILTQLTQMLLGLIAIGASGLLFAQSGYNMPQGVTETSRSVYGLHMLVLIVCAIASVVVYGLIVYSIIRHRKSRGVEAKQFHESTTVEVIWTLVPLIVLVALAVPATKALIELEDSSNPDMTIKVTGYQWKWEYEYLDHDINFFSTLSTPASQIYNREEKGEHYLLEVDNRMVVPVDTRIRILTTAADVIHAWWVPELGWKKDAIPGMVNDAWTQIDEPGVYRGQCAELCGKDHGFMPIVVEALPKDEFEAWVKEQNGTLPDSEEASEQQVAQVSGV